MECLEQLEALAEEELEDEAPGGVEDDALASCLRALRLSEIWF